MGYTQRVISGFSWESVLKTLIYGLTMVKIFFLARILDPADFGLFSLTMIAFGVCEAMTQTGINLTIIQAKESVEYFLDTAWVIAIVRGFVIGIIMILLGVLMSNFYSQPVLLSLIALAAIIPVIKGFINPYVVVLHKKMMYQHDVLYRFSISAVEILLAVLLSLWLRSAFALIAAMICSALLEVALSFIIFKQKPVFHFISSRAKLIFENARWLSVGTLLHYLVENIDDFIIGAVTSTHHLGIYHNAYSLTHKASYEISKSAHYGTIPVYTKIAQDKVRFKRAFSRSLLATLSVILFICIPIFFFNQQIISLLLGEKWLEAIPLIRPLIAAGIFQSISMLSYTVMLATKQYKPMNLHLFISLILLAGFIYVGGSNFGISGAVNGILLSRVISFPIIAWQMYSYFFADNQKPVKAKS